MTDHAILVDRPDLGRSPVVADGAMGSALIALGLPAGMPPEGWLLTPDGSAAVAAVQAGHAAAGARIVLTATFGASPVRLADGTAAGRTVDVCRAAVVIARAAAPSGVLVAGDLGPTGALLAPYGDLEPAAARDAFGAQAAALAAAGVDLLWVETMADLAEARAAVEGARDAAPGLPVVATLTFERGRTLFGDRPGDAAAALADLGVAAVGANCGTGFDAVLEVLPGLAAGAPGLPLVAKANAGRPIVGADGSATYPATPADAAAYARRAVELGALIVGGCCGTTAAHIAAIAAEIRRP
ncbi:MAG TPA: homocysteine S-methyltransferase family protein [Patescibacteria group bacterium]|nr:homocysteine S-methyltransferase family protein [Patescibacteria group bacterium]